MIVYCKKYVKTSRKIKYLFAGHSRLTGLQLPEEMCYPRLQELEPKDSPSTMQQYAAYNQQQWTYYNELMIEVYKGNYGDHFDYL